MEATINHNQNQAECMTYTWDWAVYHYYNVCTQTGFDVPFGLMDYIGTILMIVLGVGVAIGLFVGVCVLAAITYIELRS